MPEDPGPHHGRRKSLLELSSDFPMCAVGYAHVYTYINIYVSQLSKDESSPRLSKATAESLEGGRVGLSRMSSEAMLYLAFTPMNVVQ